jgi:predicted transcriptional regulator
MSRPIKDSTPVNIKMDTQVYNLLEEYAKKAGQTKTIVIERAVQEYIEKRKNNKE